MPSARAAQVNAAYYARLSPGRADYWREMAAPRHRLKTLLALLGEIRRRHPPSELCGIDLSPEQNGARRLAERAA